MACWQPTTSPQTAATPPSSPRRRLRSLRVGDMVVIGEAALTVGRFGFALLTGAFTPVDRDEHGTHPIA